MSPAPILLNMNFFKSSIRATDRTLPGATILNTSSVLQYCNCEMPINFIWKIFLFYGQKCIPTIKLVAKFASPKHWVWLYFFVCRGHGVMVIVVG